MRPCCVPGCSNKTSLRYCIPADERIRDLWLLKIQNRKLEGISDKNYLQNYRVCQIHFDNVCINDNGSLKKFALPTLNLPGYKGTAVDGNCFSYPPKMQSVTPEKVEVLQRKFCNQPTTLSDTFEYTFIKSAKTYEPTLKRRMSMRNKPEEIVSFILPLEKETVDFAKPASSVSLSKHRLLAGEPSTPKQHDTTFSLQYDKQLQAMEGFVDYGEEERIAAFADHALLFMLKGIHRKWKQPICYAFCENTTPTSHLTRLLKEVIRAVRNAGYTVVATISDQGSANCATIKNLMDFTNSYCLRNKIENKYKGYLVDGEEIVHLYDFPHLMKGIRNGLLTKRLHFIDVDGIRKTACWAHIEQMYRNDKNQGIYSQFYKLTDEHVIPSKIRKMRVKNCTQVFSHMVGTAMHLAADCSKELPINSKFYLTPAAAHTADLLLFFDALFDSVNGAALYPPHGKQLRTVVSDKSSHMDFWKKALPILKSMYFSNDTQEKVVTPSLRHWVFTLENFIYIWGTLKCKGFKHLAPRNFNQDPIENYFSCIRSYAGRNINPTCSGFITSNKSLIINNLVSPHATGANCEADESVGLLSNLKNYLDMYIQSSELSQVPPPVYPTITNFGSPFKDCHSICCKIYCKKTFIENNVHHLQRKTLHHY